MQIMSILLLLSVIQFYYYKDNWPGNNLKSDIGK